MTDREKSWIHCSDCQATSISYFLCIKHAAEITTVTPETFLRLRRHQARRAG